MARGRSARPTLSNRIPVHATTIQDPRLACVGVGKHYNVVCGPKGTSDKRLKFRGTVFCCPRTCRDDVDRGPQFEQKCGRNC